MGRSRYWGRYWSSREHIKFQRRAKTEPPLQHPAPDIAYVVRLVRTIERLKSFGRYGLPSRGSLVPWRFLPSTNLPRS
jgi:hypothetical protein